MKLINCSEKEKIPALFYFIDAEKAFDHVEWNFLKYILLKLNVSSHFLAWIDLIYSVQTTSLFLDGVDLQNLLLQNCETGLSPDSSYLIW